RERPRYGARIRLAASSTPMLAKDATNTVATAVGSVRAVAAGAAGSTSDAFTSSSAARGARHHSPASIPSPISPRPIANTIAVVVKYAVRTNPVAKLPTSDPSVATAYTSPTTRPVRARSGTRR